MKVVDTSVVVDIDRGEAGPRVSKLDEEGRHAISAVTLTELRVGVNNTYEPGTDAHAEAVEKLERLCSRFELLPVTRPVSIKAADVIADLRRRGARLDDLHDVYVAATACTNQLPVLTANVDHFERIEDADVVDWTEF